MPHIVESLTPAPSAPPAEGKASAAWILRLDQPVQDAAPATATLRGLTFAIKDNIDAAGLPTTAACPAFAYTAPANATVVNRLLGAGAALKGKTNLDQFACGLNGTRSPYGAVPNAFDARYVSGGSSSGSAYVVATGQVDFALGTDTAGSGRVPAGLNNIVGIKPSKGLLSTRGVVPAARSVDCVSILARDVPTAVHVLEVASAYDAEDAYSRPLPLDRTPFPTHFAFGVPAKPEFFGDTLAAQAFDSAVQELRAMGGHAVRIDFAPLSAVAHLLYGSALVAERYAAVRDFFDQHEEDVIEPVRSILAEGRRFTAADVYLAQQQLQGLSHAAHGAWSGLDMLCVPTAPTHCTIADMQADPVGRNRDLGYYTNFVNLLDYAAIAVPASVRSDGLPFGITLIGRAGRDLALADVAQRFHQRTGLTMGATGAPLPAATEILPPQEATDTLPIVVVGAHLRGLPLNHQLTDLGATLDRTTFTAPHYRLYALANTTPAKPGMVRVTHDGKAIAVETWRLPVAEVGRFLSGIPAPLGLGSIELEDGSWAHGFLCESVALDGAKDITEFGGWRRFTESVA